MTCAPARSRRLSRRSHRFDLSLSAPWSRELGRWLTSDQRIERELKEALSWTDPDLFCAVQIQVREGTVFLSGEVSDFELFQSLDNLVAVTPGVRYVKNGVLVVPEEFHEPPLWVGEK